MSNASEKRIKSAVEKQQSEHVRMRALTSPAALTIAHDDLHFTKTQVFEFNNANHHALFRVDTEKTKQDGTRDRLASELIWHTSPHHINQAIRAGMIKPPALTGKVIATLGHYRRQKNRELYNFEVRTASAKMKLKLLDLTQDLIEIIQPIERLAPQDDKRQANKTIRKMSGALEAIQLPINFNLIIPSAANRLRDLKNTFYYRLAALQESYDTGKISKSQLDHCLRYMMIDIVNFSQHMNQAIAYDRSRSNRGIYHHACIDARRVIDNYVFDPHNPVNKNHQWLSPDKDNQDRLLCLPLNEIGASATDLENTLMTIAQIEKHDAIGNQQGNDLNIDYGNPANPCKIYIRQDYSKIHYMLRRAGKFFKHVFTRSKQSKTARLSQTLFHTSQQNTALTSNHAADKKRVKLGAYRESNRSTYAYLCDHVNLKPISTFKLVLKSVGKLLWRTTVGGLFTFIKATLVNALQDMLAGFYYDWRETLKQGQFNPKQNQVGQTPFIVLMAKLDRLNPKPQLPDNSLNIANSSHGLETGIDNDDLLNFVFGQLQATVDDISYNVHGKMPTLGVMFNTTLITCALSFLYPAKFGNFHDLMSSLQFNGQNKTLSVLDTAYSSAFAVQESMALLSGSEVSILRTLATNALENLPAVLVSTALLATLCSLLPAKAIDDIKNLARQIMKADIVISHHMLVDPAAAVVLQVKLRAVLSSLQRHDYFGAKEKERQEIDTLTQQIQNNLTQADRQTQFLHSLQRHESILPQLTYGEKRLILAEAKQIFPKNPALLRHIDRLVFPKPSCNFLFNTLLIISTYPSQILRMVVTLGVAGDSARHFKNKVTTDLSRLVHAVGNLLDMTARYIKTSLHGFYDVIANQVISRFFPTAGYHLNKFANRVDRGAESVRIAASTGPQALRTRTTSHSIRARNLDTTTPSLLKAALVARKNTPKRAPAKAKKETPTPKKRHPSRPGVSNASRSTLFNDKNQEVIDVWHQAGQKANRTFSPMPQ